MLGENNMQEKWQQRLNNFQKELTRLNEAVVEHQRNPNDFIKESVIQRFEFTHELAWKMLRDYLQYEGYQNITGSRTATRLAFNVGLLKNGEDWMAMIETRNRTVHAYDESVLHSEFQHIIEKYLQNFTALVDIMRQKAEEI